MFRKLTLAALIAALPSLASAHMIVSDGFARSSNPQSGAAFMLIVNHSPIDDRVVSASSDAAARVELHTHEDTDGVMRMVHVEDGFPIAASDSMVMERGGAHVMFMGLTEPWAEGDEVTFTLTFEHADPVTVSFIVDNDRRRAPGAFDEPAADDHADHSDHSGHNH